MSDAGQTPGKARAGRTATARRRTRRTLSATAVDLFVSRGYEATTVDEIAESAGVGRRTFFRYFRSKEDAIFPDHGETLAMVERFFDEAAPQTPPLRVICHAAELVMSTYAEDPELSRKRFQLTRTVPSLRDKEIASIDRYQRSFARYLRQHFGTADHGALKAAVAASAVVAAHNQVLREWLKNGARDDVQAAAREALRFVEDTLTASFETERPDDQDAVVVALVRTGAPLHSVLERFEDAAKQLG